MKESDFYKKTITVEQAVPNAVLSLRKGLRYCGVESGGAMGFGYTHHGVADCFLEPTNDKAICDMYMGTGYKGRTDVVLGRIDFYSNIKGTSTVELRVKKSMRYKEEVIKSWEGFINGKTKNICPKT